MAKIHGFIGDSPYPGFSPTRMCYVPFAEFLLHMLANLSIAIDDIILTLVHLLFVLV
jgi:hypothetical protein